MPHPFTPDERALLEMSDEAVDQLWIRAQAGDGAALEKLYDWTRLSARDYYVSRMPFEEAFSYEDAEDLAQDFFTEFQQYWSTVRKSLCHWARRLMRNRLVSFKKKSADVSFPRTERGWLCGLEC